MARNVGLTTINITSNDGEENNSTVCNDEDSDMIPLLSKKMQTGKWNASKKLQLKPQKLQSENIQLDWWSKLFASESKDKTGNSPELSAVKLKMYDRELEVQPEFNGFKDLVQTYSLVRGHRCMDESPPEIATFKGGFSLLDVDAEQDIDTIPMNLQLPPVIQPQHAEQTMSVLARIYIVKARRLRPKDIDGLSDPYITIRTNLGQRVRDRDNYVTGELNPIFGKCYELVLSLPREYQLVIGVFDRDESSADDLIGETQIDVENRLLSRHRAHCGISERYDKSGYNMWRDGEQPTEILQSLCMQHSIAPPLVQEQQITVGPLTVMGPPEANQEQLALAVLRRWDEVTGWCIVPEHIESRPLYLPRRPGVEQGRLLMWLDLFPGQGCVPNLPVDISPRTPIAYELRVIVWNAEGIPLNDTNIMGKRMSDIFFKCWLGEEKSHQRTDIHYRSMTGEGQFNWRMLFPFSYWPATCRMVIQKKILAGIFSRGEQLVPCTLTVQAWDADLISPDDFLGSTCLELCRLPHGAKSTQSFELKLAESDHGVCNLFLTQKTRGWWPLKDNKGKPAGKVELELEVVTAKEALKHPVGKGRDPPEPLSPPNRPDVSFLWLINPARAARIVLWRQYKKKILCFCCLVVLMLPVLLTFFALPILFVNKLLSFW